MFFSWISAHIPSTDMLERLWLMVHLIFDVIFIVVIVSLVVFLIITEIYEHHEKKKGYKREK